MALLAAPAGTVAVIWVPALIGSKGGGGAGEGHRGDAGEIGPVR